MRQMQELKIHGKQRHVKKNILIITILTIVVLAVIYLSLSFYFKTHFFLHTEINGLKAGGKTAEEAKEKIAAEVGDYLLTIFDRDGNKYHIMGRDIDNHYVPDGSLEKALEEQNMFAWLPSLFQKNKIDVDTPMAYDKEKLQAAVKILPCFQEENIIRPVNAALERQEDHYELIPEVMGNQLIMEKVLKVVEAAVTDGAGSITLTDELYVNPEIVSDSPAVQGALEKLETYTGTEIIYKIADYDEKLGGKEIFDMIQADEDFSISFIEKKVSQFVQSLATKYNTYGDLREFQTSSGDTIEIGGGDYGWVVNKEKEAEQLKADVMSGQRVEREPIYSQRAKAEGSDDIGDTYVEIDYTGQHMWYYEESELVLESDIVTGNISKGNGSPDGLFKIVYKQSPAVLKGEDYESDVEYFMPFAYNVGFHDASWRSRFGGDYYKTQGSHGCINMPGEKAKELYARIEVDTPVIAYYREPVELTAKNCKIANAFSYVEPEKEVQRTE